MRKLTDTQLIALSSAAARDDGAAKLPERMSKAAAAKVGASLVARKLMREIRSKPGMPIWREDEDGRAFSLVILRAGREAIGVEQEDGASKAAAEPNAASAEPVTAKTRKGKSVDAPVAAKRAVRMLGLGLQRHQIDDVHRSLNPAGIGGLSSGIARSHGAWIHPIKVFFSELVTAREAIPRPPSGRQIIPLCEDLIVNVGVLSFAVLR